MNFEVDALSVAKAEFLKMRKYYQLILVIVSVVSLFSFLFYRHEYNRLRYVLEVLNFFGKPGQATLGSECLPNVTLNDSDSIEFTTPLPSWQRIADNFYIYSSFWDNKEQTNNYVTSFAIVRGNTDMKFGCHLWYEDSENPVSGTFSYSVLKGREANETMRRGLQISQSGNGNVVAYYLFCKPEGVSGIPYGTTFYKTDSYVPSEVFVPVFPVHSKGVTSNATVVCVLPNKSPGVPKSRVFEFLSYYQLIGVKFFIFYDTGVPQKVHLTLKKSKIFGFFASVLPWNFPFGMDMNDVIAAVIEEDCILRAKGKVENVLVLSLDDYIVPKYHHTIFGLINDFDRRKTTARFSFTNLVFCIEFPNDQNIHNQPIKLLPLQKTMYSKDLSHSKTFYIYRPHRYGNRKDIVTQRVTQGIASVHQYKQCYSDNVELSRKSVIGKGEYEPAVIRFSTDWLKSRLLKLWLTGQL